MPIGVCLIGRFCRGVRDAPETRESPAFDHPSSDDATVSLRVAEPPSILAAPLAKAIALCPTNPDLPRGVFRFNVKSKIPSNEFFRPAKLRQNLEPKGALLFHKRLFLQERKPIESNGHT